MCLRITGNRTDAADATQEALIGIVKGLPRFDGRSRFTTWAYRVAANAALDEVRRRGRRPVPLSSTDDPEGGGADRSDRLAESAAPDPDARMDVTDALSRLPVDFRAAVVLRDLCGLDYAEIAEVLRVPPGTVRSRISRGRAALVPLLGGNLGADPNRPTPTP